MTWQNVLALAVFVSVCGLIAYVGDILGRRMGKRRLSLFGLRPRYTAIVTTSITGMLIAIFTIAAMSITSKQVHELVLRGSQVLQDLQDTRDELRKTRAEVVRQKSVAENEREQARQAAIARDAQRAELARVNKDLLALRNELQRNRVALARTERALSQAKGDLASARKEVAARQRQIAQQTVDIAKMRQSRQELQRGLAIYQRSYNELRGRKIILHPNQDIARRVINCSEPKNRIRSEFMSLLDDVSKKATEEGARAGDNGRAVFFPPTLFRGQKRPYVEAEILDAIVDSIYSGSGTVVARIYSAGNSFEGEKAAVDCELIANRLVYPAGAEVASTVIDGGASNGKIFNDLVVFLQTDVRSAAIYKGVVPTLDENGQRSVGQINDWDKVLDLILRIKAAGKKVRVRAVAAGETWSVGPLPIDFLVGSA